MRCKAGRTGGPVDEDFELSRFYHFKQGSAPDDGGLSWWGGWDGVCLTENIQLVLGFLLLVWFPFFRQSGTKSIFTAFENFRNIFKSSKFT